MRTWTPPSGWTAGEKPPASRLDTDVRDNLLSAGEWVSFDPELSETATGVISVGTDGVSTARYCRINDTIIAEYYVYWGYTSPNFGSGFYTWKLPAPPAGVQDSNGECVGHAAAYHSGAYSGVCRLTADNTVLTYDRFYVTSAPGPGAWSTTSPWTWASGDYMYATITYEAYPARPNLLSKQDSGLEATGVGSWQANLGTPSVAVANSTTRAILGTHSLQATWGAAAAYATGFVCNTGAILTVGETYTFSIDVYVPTGSPLVYAEAYFQTHAPPPGWPQDATVRDQWQRLACTFVATATSHYLGISQLEASDSGDLMWVDNARLEVGAVCTPPPFRVTAARSWKAGEKPTAAIMNAQIRDNVGGIGQWHEHAWVPTWTATGTAPSLGNGTLTGRYTMVGKTVFAQLRLTMGSTTTYGTGSWLFSLPVARYDTGASSWPVLGVAALFNAGVGDYGAVARHGTTTSNVVLDTTALGNVYSVVPFTWGVGDVVSINYCYEAA